jgi:hypothetical protein
MDLLSTGTQMLETMLMRVPPATGSDAGRIGLFRSTHPNFLKPERARVETLPAGQNVKRRENCCTRG